MPNTLQRILSRRGDAKNIKEYIEGLHGLLYESLRVLSETAVSTTHEMVFCNALTNGTSPSRRRLRACEN